MAAPAGATVGPANQCVPSPAVKSPPVTGCGVIEGGSVSTWTTPPASAPLPAPSVARTWYETAPS